MIRDPIVRQIEEGLNGDLNPDVFQECANALLLDAYPNLAPMKGGDDAGFDGAIGTEDGPYPLLCTIDKRGPLANFRKNIETKLRKCGGPKLAVIATPRALSNPKKRTLYRIAKEDYGVSIVNIYDQPYFVIRLYECPEWRRRLLGISGRPPALSEIPPRPRPERPPLIGRDQEIDWLRQSSGDLLLVGQPGLGKTFLHEELARQGEALFLIDSDSERVADALRKLSPKVVVVDDADGHKDWLQALIRLRNQLGFQFSIHANCWPNSEGEICGMLNIPLANIKKLLPLTREQVLTLIKAIGVYGPDKLLHLLLAHADGKPGLAAAMVIAVKRGEIDRVWSGEAVAESLLEGHELIGDGMAKAVLACLSFGGDYGMTVEEVAKGLKLTPLETRNIIMNLAAGGVVEQINPRYGESVARLIVRPEVLRGLLIRDVFYSGAALDPSFLIKNARSVPARRIQLTHSLVAAYQRGAGVPQQLLFKLAEECESKDVWRHLGYANNAIAQVILDQYQQHLPAAAPGLLLILPDVTLRKLLPHATGEEGDEARKHIKEWINGEEPGDTVTLPRRRQLLGALRAIKQEYEGDFTTNFAWTVPLLLSPAVDMSRMPPGDGMKIVIYRGIRPLDQLQEIADLWSDALLLFNDASIIPQEIRSVIEDWCFPNRHASATVSHEVHQFMQQKAKQMLCDIQDLPAFGRVARSWVRRITKWAKLDVNVKVDRNFHRIFSGHGNPVNWELREQRRRVLLQGVADRLAALGPDEAMSQLASMERETASFGWQHGWDRITMYHHLAKLGKDCIAWLSAGLEHKLPTNYIHPFVAAAASKAKNAVLPLLSNMLCSDEYKHLACITTISLPNPPDTLLQTALEGIQPSWDKLCYPIKSANPPESTMALLLQDKRVAVRVHAAFAEWLIEPEGQVRPLLQKAWRKAILDAWQEDEYLLEQVLSKDKELAMAWMFRKFQQASEDAHRHWLWRVDRLISGLSKDLSVEQRWELLDRLVPVSYESKIAGILFRGDAELFRRWLFKHLELDERMRLFALNPLDRDIDEIWEQFALVALDEGASPDEIARFAMPISTGVIEGPMSAYYRGVMPRYEQLALHADDRLHVAGRMGLKWARESAEREEERERLEAVRGY